MTSITDMTAVDLVAAITQRELTCEAVMEAHLAQIEAKNPGLNALVAVRSSDDLMAEARDMDRQGPKGPLAGLPFALKDLVEVKGILSTHGSPIYTNHVPEKDDYLAARIRASGAILIGKTNTPEFGLGSQSYNPVHGVTRNPFDATKCAGGSSGGAAAALAAHMVPLADGSDMMGSLRNPAAFCGVYGLRPSYGLVSSDVVGDVFLSQLATEGPMARNVDDLALLLDVLAGPNPRHPHSVPQQPSFAQGLAMPTSAKRIGWIGDWNGYYPMESGILQTCEISLARFESAGIEVVPLIPDFDPARLWQAWITLRSFIVANGLKVFYNNPDHRNLLKPEAIFEIERGLALSPEAIYAASAVRSEWFVATANLFEQFDAIALPSAQVFPFDADIHWPREIAGRTMDTYHRWMEIVIPASIIGLPALAIPSGLGPSGLPTGIQLIGPRLSDQELLRIGKRIAPAR